MIYSVYTWCFIVLVVFFYNKKGKTKLCIMEGTDLGTTRTQKHITSYTIITFWMPCI